MTVHSTLGPSSAARWIACPGSVALCERAPRQPTSEYAAEGMVAHDLAERYASGKLDFETLVSMIGQVVPTDGHDIEVSEEMVGGAVEYLDAITESRRHFEINPKSLSTIEKFEHRVHASSVDERCWGTTDHCLYRKGDILFVDDYKFGKGKIVEVEQNKQSMLYAIGIMDSEAGWAFGKVCIRIVQPRGDHPEGTVREWWTTPAELRSWREAEARPAAQEALRPGARLVPGPDQCRWCPASAFCPALHEKAQEQAQATFAIAPVAGGRDLPDIKMLTVEQLGQALHWQKAFEAWFVAIKAVVLEKLTAGEDVPGWKIVAGRANRQWRSEEEVVAAFGPVLGEKLYSRKIVSPTVLEKMVGKKTPIGYLIVKPEGKKSVAPDGDPRPAVASAPQDAFAIAEPARQLGRKPGQDVPAAADEAWCEECDILGSDVCSRHTAKKSNGVLSSQDLAAELLGGGTQSEPEGSKIWPA